MGGTCYQFGDFRFDPGSGQLLGGGGVHKLRPQAAQTLELLLKSAGEVVTRDELRRELWPDKRVVLFEVSISAVIRELRRALDDEPRKPRYIETIPRRGYRFIAEVRERGTSMPRPAGPHPGCSFGRGVAGVVERAGAFITLISAVLLMGGSVSIPASRSGELAEGPDMALLLQPFRVLDNSPRARALTAALDDELATMLGRAELDALEVVQVRLSDELPRGVSHVLDGSLRSEGEELVVTARVAEAEGGSLSWSDSFRMTGGSDALAVREVSARIAATLLQRVLPPLSDRPAEASADPAALEKWKEARRVLSANTAEATAEAISLLKEAVAADAGFAPAQSALAAALLRWPGPRKTSESVQRAREAARRALVLHPADATAHRVLGEIALYLDRDWDEAGSRLDRAVSLSPDDAVIRDARAAWLSARGRHDEALREIELAAALEPAAVAISIDVMLFHYYARDFDETLRAARRLAVLWPENILSDLYTILANQARGDLTAAAEQARRTMAGWRAAVGDESPLPSDDEEALSLFWQRYLMGVKRLPSPEQVALAMAEAQLGELDEAAARIGSAIANKEFSYGVAFLGVNPALDPLRGRADFELALRSLGQAALSDYYRSTVAANEGP